jgi:hypothetical protein
MSDSGDEPANKRGRTTARQLLDAIGYDGSEHELKKLPSLASREAGHFTTFKDLVAANEQLAAARAAPRRGQQGDGDDDDGDVDDDDDDDDAERARELAMLEARVSKLKKDVAGGNAMMRILRGGTAKLASLILPGAPEKLLQEGGFDCRLEMAAQRKRDSRAVESREEAADKMTEALAIIVEKGPRNSLQRRAACALLVKCLDRRQMQDLAARHPALAAYQGGWARIQAYDDFNAMVDGYELIKVKRMVARFNEEHLRRLVSFLLSPSSVVPLSWGMRNVKLSKYEVVKLPSPCLRLATGGSVRRCRTSGPSSCSPTTQLATAAG